MINRGAPDGTQFVPPFGIRGIGGSHWYTDDLVLPANTLEASPIDLEMILEKGFISQITMLFPPGPATLAHVVVLINGIQKFPYVSGQNFHPDNMQVIIPCDEDVPSIAGTYKIVFRGWNLDDTWPHTIQCNVWVIPYP